MDFKKIPRPLLITLTSAVLFGAVIAIATYTHGCKCPTPPSQMASGPSMESTEAKAPTLNEISLALGHYLSRHLNTPALQYDLEKVIEGMRAEAAGSPSPLSEEAFTSAIAQMQAVHMEAIAQQNLIKAEVYLEQNAKEPNVVCINSQLQYKVLQKGTESADGFNFAVESSSTPLIHFCCKLLDGTVISSSYENADPISLPLEHALAGIREGMIGMKEGEKRSLCIHPALGFGTAAHLPPNSLLIFEVEVLSLKESPEAEEALEATLEESKAAMEGHLQSEA